MHVLVHNALRCCRIVSYRGGGWAEMCGMWQVRGDAKHAIGQHVQCRDEPRNAGICAHEANRK